MSKTASRVLWAVALCVLAVALFFFNRPAATATAPAAPAAAVSAESAESPAAESAEVPESADSTEPAAESAEVPESAEATEPDAAAPTPVPVPEGSDVGLRLPSFTLTDLNGETFRLEEHRGQTVIINLWATWCDPCLKELTHFDRIQRENPESVAVLAVHSGWIIEDIPAFVAGLDTDLRYAVDETGAFTALVGGTAALPHTLVLNPDGVVIYNRPGPVTYALLAELVEMAQGE